MTATTIINRRSSYKDGEGYVIPEEEQPNNNNLDNTATTTVDKESSEEKDMPSLDIDIVVDTTNFKDLDDACYILVQNLSIEEKEQAARYSYQYFVESESGDSSGRREHYAMKMARNHIIAEKGNIKKALIRLKETLVWRQQIQIDDMRKCFNPKYKYNTNNSDNKNDDVDDVDGDNGEGLVSYAELRHGLYDHMESGRAITQGYDKEGRAIYYLQMHKYTHFHPKFYSHLHFYLLDRALAATETRTQGKKPNKVMVIFDYSQYGRKNIIPFGVAKTFLMSFERYWPETAYKIVLLDTPFLFRAFWMIIKPLLDPDTKSKILILNSTIEKETTLRQLISENQAAPCMLLNGQMKREFNKTEYFERTPYNHTFNEQQQR